MALSGENGNGFFMPVAPAYGGGNGFGNGFGGDWAWIILLLLLGWGNNGNGFGGGAGGNGLYPWLNQQSQMTDGFQNQLLHDSITSTRDGVQNLATQLCGGFGNIQNSLCNGFAGVEQGANTRQIANMQTAFDLQSSLQNCCCENRAGIADLKYTVATENCQDRAASYQNTRDIIDANNRNSQAILDKLCQLELDGVKAQISAKDDIIAQLRQENLYARGQASQVAQTAEIENNIYNRLKNCPVGTTPVYGNTPIFTCAQNVAGGCGCGGNSFIN